MRLSNSLLLSVLFTLALTVCALVRVPLYKINKEPLSTEEFSKVIDEFKARYEMLQNVKEIGDRLGVVGINTKYFGKISLGTPAQEFNVEFSTNCFISNILSRQCDMPECSNFSRYDNSKSSTYKANGAPINPSTFSKGFLSEDVLEVGGLSIKNQTFAEITESNFTYVDGELCLDFPLNEAPNILPPFYNMVNQKLVDEAIFSVYLNRDQKATPGGEIIFGGSDEDLYDKESLNYVKLSKEERWRIKIDRISVQNGVELCTEGCEAKVDFSFPLMFVPEKLEDYVKPKTGSIDCDKINDFPSVTFTIGGQNYTLDGKDYFTELEDGNNSRCSSDFLGINFPLESILGSAFFRKYYSIFDVKNKQIGFANLK